MGAWAVLTIQRQPPLFLPLLLQQKKPTFSTIMKYSLLLLVATACLLGCDPARRIEMKNLGNDTAQVIWRVKKDSIGFNAFNLSNSRELKFTLLPNRKDGIKMSFGVGVWSPEEVERLVHQLESFEIKNAGENMRIDSMAVLRNFLLSRRKGSSKIQILVGQ